MTKGLLKMAKDDSYVEYTKRSRSEQVNGPQENWARVKDFRDPVSGKKLNSIGDTRPQSQVNPSPLGNGVWKETDFGNPGK
jgi:hypothetical protein